VAVIVAREVWPTRYAAVQRHHGHSMVGQLLIIYELYFTK